MFLPFDLVCFACYGRVLHRFGGLTRFWAVLTPSHFLGTVRGISRVPALLAEVSKTPARRVSWPCGRSMGSENFNGARKKTLYCAGVTVILKVWLRVVTRVP